MTELDKLQKKAYNERLNYRIEYTAEGHDCVAVYFTSNALFSPHSADAFRFLVMERDRYEWRRNMVSRAQKHIFLRDIYKQWYASGINAEINSVDRLTEWLREQTNGYKSLIFSGSSGGGYAAALFGARLHADLVLDFNGQWDICDSIERDGKIISPILKRMQVEGHKGIRYFSLVKDEFDYSRTVYFVSIKSPGDAKQLGFVNGFKRIHVIRFWNSHHGIPFLKNALPKVMNMSLDELVAFESNVQNPVLFSIRLAGLRTSLRVGWKIVGQKFSRKFLRCSNMTP